jgi:DNA-directed RNA polymerase subunit N (RpoN/RPB10)
MEIYKEYPIRCKTCNEQIACFAAEYHALLGSGLSQEAALDELGITDYCSRSAMINPTNVPFNMENREVIEGFKVVDEADEAYAQNESTARPVFNRCINLQTNIPIPAQSAAKPPQQSPLLGGLTTPVTKPQSTLTDTRFPAIPIQLNLGQQTRANREGLQTIGVAQPTKRHIPTVLNVTTPPNRQIVTTNEENITVERPVIPGIDLDIDYDNLGVGIEVKNENFNPTKFEEPTTVGVPTINSDPTIPPVTVYAGAGKNVTVLNGRTYLAQ